MIIRKVRTILGVLLTVAVAAGAAQPGLTLGGKFIPKDHLYVFLLAGNSAMSGRATGPDTVIDPRAFKFMLSSSCPTAYKNCPAQFSWQAAVDPLCFDSNNPDGTTGIPKSCPGMPFLKRLVTDKNIPSSYYFAVMQTSGSGWTLDGHMLSTKGDFKTLTTQAKALMPNVTIGGFISMFNLVEVQNWLTTPAQVNDYLTNVIAMVRAVRTTLGIDTLPYIHSGYPIMAAGDYSLTSGKNMAGAQKIVSLIKLIPDSLKRATVIPTDSFPVYKDGYLSHYDKIGNVGWGNRTGDTVVAMINRHWIPGPAIVGVKGGGSIGNPSVAPEMVNRKLFFNGSDRSVFVNAGPAAEIYSPSGRVVFREGHYVAGRSGLPRGIYIVRVRAQTAR
jgi:hypothetical protein